MKSRFEINPYYALLLILCLLPGCATEPRGADVLARLIKNSLKPEIDYIPATIDRDLIRSKGRDVMTAGGTLDKESIPRGYQVWVVVEKNVEGTDFVWPKENFLANNQGYVIPSESRDKNGHNSWEARFSEPYGNTPVGTEYHLSLYLASESKHREIITWINANEGKWSYPGILKENFKAERMTSVLEVR